MAHCVAEADPLTHAHCITKAVLELLMLRASTPQCRVHRLASPVVYVVVTWRLHL